MMENHQVKEKVEVKSYSDWMSELPPGLQQIPLWNLSIPGSHDTMSYDLDVNSEIIEPSSLKKFSKVSCVRQIVKRWSTAQEENVTTQLEAGVRYFDLRVARKKNDPMPMRTYFYHGLYTCTDVETILKEINEWAEKHPKEILILALSHFRMFDRNIHSNLICHIKEIFGNKIIFRMKTPQDAPTLKSCWDTKRHVIVSYADDEEVQMHPELWRSITYYYGDTMNPVALEEKLSKDLKTAPSDVFFVCGLNLTLPEDAGALKYIMRWKSLMQVTLETLPGLLTWLKKQAEETHMSIVASDFVTRAGFVSTVLQLNPSKFISLLQNNHRSHPNAK